jgi:hypothetical protein
MVYSAQAPSQMMHRMCQKQTALTIHSEHEFGLDRFSAMHTAKSNLVWELHAADFLILDIEVQRGRNTRENGFKDSSVAY